jgi:lysophospholipase L1-like esterase
MPLPDDFIVPDAKKGWTPNNCMTFLLPDGRSLVQLAPVARVQPGGPIYGYCWEGEDLYGSGITGSHGGSGMSAIGGSIRKGELTGDQPIRHALKVLFWCKPWVAYNNDGTRGYRWPARNADGYANAESYGGKVPALEVGALLALPPSLTPAQLGLKTDMGRKLFHALQDYGAYMVDDSAWSCHSIAMEDGVKAEIKAKWGFSLGANTGDLKHDYNALFRALCVVDNNSPTNIGGGGKPRQPLAPPLPEPPQKTTTAPAPELKSAPPTIVLRNGDMSAGSDAPANWNQKWEGKGRIAIARDTKTYKIKPAALRITSVGGEAQGMVSQVVEAPGGRKFTVQGWVKSEGSVKVNVAIQPFTENWKPITFLQIHYVQNNTDWVTFQKEIELPADTARFQLGLLLEGEGKAWLSGVSLQGANVKNEGVEPEQVPPPEVQNPEVPIHGYFPEYPQAWSSFHRGFVEEAKKGKAEIVFFGDSLTQGWGGDGKAEWDRRFAPLNAVNFGIGGDRVQQILWRVQQGSLKGLKPKVIVLMIGVNNLWRDVSQYKPTGVAAGMKRILNEIRTRCPNAKILLLGILPTQNPADNPLRATIEAINREYEKLAITPQVSYYDFGNLFKEKDGSLDKAIMPDLLHLSPAGYKRLADALEPLIKQRLP